jgi:DNA-binding NarL/FixJ family response regulator
MTTQLNSRDSGSARILIVDDEPLNVDYLEQELESHGYVTETAANGVEALERVAARPPDLVLLDVMMPAMDGITALRLLKQDPETRLIPVVLMTALTAVDDRVRGIEAGADDFLSKPVDDRELLARIKTALSLRRAIEDTVGQLRSSSAYLERYGSQERDVAILAVQFRARDPDVNEGAVDFFGRRRRERAEELIGALGGVTGEGDGPIVAVFEGPDARSRCSAAVEAARSVVDDASNESAGNPADVVASAAVSAGLARVGSARVQRGVESRWVYAASGEPVERASGLAAEAGVEGVVVSREVAMAVRDRFAVQPSGDGRYVVAGPREPDAVGPRAAAARRRVKTILVSDIVGSTRTLERVGDRAGGLLMDAHERLAREELVVFGGEELDTAGDSFLAAFDSAAGAVRYGLVLIDRVGELGMGIRVGIHTGELEEVDGRPRGIALHIAARIADRATPNEILISTTTRELASGAALRFVDRGEHALKGVSEPRRLFAAREEAGSPGESSPTVPGSDIARTAVSPGGLTAREVDVLRLVAVGLSDAQVAAQLVVSVRTVNAHLRSIYRKTGAHSRAAAGRFAEENGLL